MHLIDEFKRLKWRTPRLAERICELQKDSEQTFLFCKAYLQEFDESATIFNDCLSYVSQTHLEQLVQIAVQKLAQGNGVNRNEAINDLICHVALQNANLLHPYLELLYRRGINADAYYFCEPWRGVSEQVADKFIELLKASKSDDNRDELVGILFASRNLKVVKQTYDYALQILDKQRVDLLLEDVNLVHENGQIRDLCPPKTYHIIFSHGYFAPSSQPYLARDKHPTYLLQTDERGYKFGGTVDESDQNSPFLHLITLDPVPSGLGVSLAKLVLGVHICLVNDGWGEVHYRHDIDGKPVKISQENEIANGFDKPIVPCKVHLAPTPSRWLRQDWGCSNGRENLFRLGGEPTWIQGAQIPQCQICARKMSFLMQLDTGLPDIGGGELYFGSGGILYVFWCDKCKTSAYLMQCT